MQMENTKDVDVYDLRADNSFSHPQKEKSPIETVYRRYSYFPITKVFSIANYHGNCKEPLDDIYYGFTIKW